MCRSAAQRRERREREVGAKSLPSRLRSRPVPSPIGYPPCAMALPPAGAPSPRRWGACEFPDPRHGRGRHSRCRSHTALPPCSCMRRAVGRSSSRMQRADLRDQAVSVRRRRDTPERSPQPLRRAPTSWRSGMTRDQPSWPDRCARQIPRRGPSFDADVPIVEATEHLGNLGINSPLWMAEQSQTCRHQRRVAHLCDCSRQTETGTQKGPGRSRGPFTQ